LSRIRGGRIVGGTVAFTPARLRLVDVDTDVGCRALVGAAMREGRADAARRAELQVAGPDGLEWTVRRLLLPRAMRPHPPSELVELAHPSNEVVAALPMGFLVAPLALVFLPFVLLGRALRLLPWTIEARTYPWGRRVPPILFAYEVRGREETERAMGELAAALARGDGAPTVPGAERVS
jgi:hypothetical protein